MRNVQRANTAAPRFYSMLLTALSCAKSREFARAATALCTGTGPKRENETTPNETWPFRRYKCKRRGQTPLVRSAVQEQDGVSALASALAAIY